MLSRKIDELREITATVTETLPHYLRFCGKSQERRKSEYIRVGAGAIERWLHLAEQSVLLRVEIPELAGEPVVLSADAVNTIADIARTYHGTINCDMVYRNTRWGDREGRIPAMGKGKSTDHGVELRLEIGNDEIQIHGPAGMYARVLGAKEPWDTPEPDQIVSLKLSDMKVFKRDPHKFLKGV